LTTSSRVVACATFVAVALAVLTATAADASPAFYHRYFVAELSVSNAIESDGIYYAGRKVAIDNAVCIGLRRFGVRTVRYEDHYWRFKCIADGANGHTYTVQVWTTGLAGYWHPEYLSVVRTF
jgi:hypothetical protein